MGDAVGFVERGDGSCDGREGGDFGVREESKRFLVSLMLVFLERAEGRAYSASNWLGRIRSASPRRFL